MRTVLLISAPTGSHVGKFSHGRELSLPEIRVTFETFGESPEDWD